MKPVLTAIWKSKIVRGFALFALWLALAGLSFYTAFVLQEMFFRIYVYCCSNNYFGFTIVRQWTTIFLMLFWVVFIGGSIDYHLKHFDELRSWKVFGWSYLIVIILLSLALFF
jgi:hypothetical protein